jgi:elongation factor P--beta-lysine ligase
MPARGLENRTCLIIAEYPTSKVPIADIYPERVRYKMHLLAASRFQIFMTGITLPAAGNQYKYI